MGILALRFVRAEAVGPRPLDASLLREICRTEQRRSEYDERRVSNPFRASDGPKWDRTAPTAGAQLDHLSISIWLRRPGPIFIDRRRDMLRCMIS
jgi:hypothetical protein